MKINIDIDLSPEEARKIMGLPDLEPMQKQLLEKVQAKMDESIEQMNDPELFFKRFMPVGIQAMDQFQQFFSQLAKAGTTSNKATTSKSKTTK